MNQRILQFAAISPCFPGRLSGPRCAVHREEDNAPASVVSHPCRSPRCREAVYLWQVVTCALTAFSPTNGSPPNKLTTAEVHSIEPPRVSRDCIQHAGGCSMVISTAALRRWELVRSFRKGLPCCMRLYLTLMCLYVTVTVQVPTAIRTALPILYATVTNGSSRTVSKVPPRFCRNQATLDWLFRQLEKLFRHTLHAVAEPNDAIRRIAVLLLS